jgi:hypothetical protein
VTFPVLPRCPRRDCINSLSSREILVCAVDFHALASSCRGKKRLGEPEAAMIEGRGRGLAYGCATCGQWHNGKAMDDQLGFQKLLRETVMALRDDPRVGWRGILNLADAWHPDVSERSEWSLGLDQRAAYAYAVT